MLVHVFIQLLLLLMLLLKLLLLMKAQIRSWGRCIVRCCVVGCWLNLLLWNWIRRDVAPRLLFELFRGTAVESEPANIPLCAICELSCIWSDHPLDLLWLAPCWMQLRNGIWNPNTHLVTRKVSDLLGLPSFVKLHSHCLLLSTDLGCWVKSHLLFKGLH